MPAAPAQELTSTGELDGDDDDDDGDDDDGNGKSLPSYKLGWSRRDDDL